MAEESGQMRRVMESVARANDIASNRIVFLDKGVAELDGSELGDTKVLFYKQQNVLREITSETLPRLKLFILNVLINGSCKHYVHLHDQGLQVWTDRSYFCDRSF